MRKLGRWVRFKFSALLKALAATLDEPVDTSVAAASIPSTATRPQRLEAKVDILYIKMATLETKVSLLLGVLTTLASAYVFSVLR